MQCYVADWSPWLVHLDVNRRTLDIFFFRTQQHLALQCFSLLSQHRSITSTHTQMNLVCFICTILFCCSLPTPSATSGTAAATRSQQINNRSKPGGLEEISICQWMSCFLFHFSYQCTPQVRHNVSVVRLKHHNSQLGAATLPRRSCQVRCVMRTIYRYPLQ